MKLPLTFFVLIALPCSLLAQVKELPGDVRGAVEAGAKFHPLAKTSDLPAAILSLVTGPGGKIAEPGGKWEATDAISDLSLPARRLIWAATDGYYYVVHSERGGIAHSFHLLIAALSPNETTPGFVWSVRTQPLDDYGAFVNALRANTLDADRPRAR